MKATAIMKNKNSDQMIKEAAEEKRKEHISKQLNKIVDDIEDEEKKNPVIDAIRESVEKNGVEIQVVQMDCGGDETKVIRAIKKIVSSEIKEIKEDHFRESIAKFSIDEIEDGLKEIAKKEILAERMHRDAKQMLKTVRELLLAKMEQRRAEESMPLLRKMIEES